MKRIIPILLLLLLLAGCKGLYPDEYISVEEHEAPFAYKETTLASTEAPPETEPPLTGTVLPSRCRYARRISPAMSPVTSSTWKSENSTTSK